jgi:hypothetical protein
VKPKELTPQFVERWSMRDMTALIASTTVGLAIMVFLGDFVVRGATPAVIGLLALTLGAESVTLISHSRAAVPRDALRLRRLTRMHAWSRTIART